MSESKGLFVSMCVPVVNLQLTLGEPHHSHSNMDTSDLCDPEMNKVGKDNG